MYHFIVADFKATDRIMNDFNPIPRHICFNCPLELLREEGEEGLFPTQEGGGQAERCKDCCVFYRDDTTANHGERVR